MDEANEELPSIARQDSKVSRTSRLSEVKTGLGFAPPDMTPFLKDIEKLNQDINELTSKIESTFVTKDLFDVFVAQYNDKTEDIVSYNHYSIMYKTLS